jgi:hypothetical protein
MSTSSSLSRTFGNVSGIVQNTSWTSGKEKDALYEDQSDYLIWYLAINLCSILLNDHDAIRLDIHSTPLATATTPKFNLLYPP